MLPSGRTYCQSRVNYTYTEMWRDFNEITQWCEVLADLLALNRIHLLAHSILWRRCTTLTI